MADSFVDAEIASQPECWRTALAALPTFEKLLPQRGERVAIVGCGTSAFMAMAYAATREAAGHGVTDAFVTSEYPHGREYDRVIALSRSGTTTEVIDFLERVGDARTLAITGSDDTPVATMARDNIALPFADERSVVQTRFPTTVLTLLRAHLGEDVRPLIEDAEKAFLVDIDDLLTARQVTFLGRGAAVGFAYEAALKVRESAQLWAEAYPAMEYRHGPIAIAQPDRLVWSLGEMPPGLDDDIARTGATHVRHDVDPMVGLTIAQRFAVALAGQRGLDPDNPRALTRAVILGS